MTIISGSIIIVIIIIIVKITVRVVYPRRFDSLKENVFIELSYHYSRGIRIFNHIITPDKNFSMMLHVCCLHIFAVVAISIPDVWF